ncbi:MAG TPA: radical SAM protein [Candidatus Binatia bacterium]|jgi:DNA repair photolyase|nr:radical SAM protein [Candidatus Binatia bacterium]
MPITIAPITVKTALTRTGGFLYAFTHSLTPYWGCSYGRSCFYCYVGESPLQHLRADGLSWGEWGKPKLNIAEVLERELQTFAHRGAALRIFFSGATEPFPPGLEPKYHLSGKCLEALRRFPPAALVIQTRSPLVERYFEVIAAIPTAVLNVTIETDNDEIRRRLTPSCATIERRLAVVRAATARGIFTQITVSPALPHDPERFAELIADSCHRVIIDDFVNGDGAQGARSRRRGVPETLARHGYLDWFGPETTRSLHSALVRRMGENRVGYSRVGFNHTEILKQWLPGEKG